MCRVRRSGAAALLFMMILCGAAHGQAQESTPGTQIEVREGDLWTKVTLVKKEGRKTLIRYEDGTEEWVTADRLRGGSPGTPADSAAPARQSAESAPAAGSASPAAAKSAFNIGNAVEYKHGAFWHPGHIVRTQRGWYLVKDDQGRDSFWCEPWALRTVGAGYDIDSWGAKGDAVRLGESAPTEPPGPSPKLKGTTSQTGGAAPGAPGLAAAPPVKIDFDNAVDPQPANGAAALNFPTTRPSVEFGAATLRPKSNHLASIVACRDTPNVIVVGFGGIFNQPSEVVRFDCAARRQLDVRGLSANNQHLVGAANAGKVLLTTVGDFRPRTLGLWELEAGVYKSRGTFEVVSDGTRCIAQAALIDAAHAMFRDDRGAVYILDLAAKKATGYIKSAAGCEPFLHPNGQLLAVLTEGKTALLLRTADFTTIAEFPDAGSRGNVAVDPTGECAAYPTAAGTVRIVRIADGSTVGTIAMGAGFGGHLDMPNPNVVLADYKAAYEAKSGIPIWLYTFPNTAPNETKACLTAAGQVTYCLEVDNVATACVATVPDAAARAAIKNVTKDAFMLTPGMSLSISGDFSVFGDEADKASELVRNAITAAGLTVSETPQPFKISVSRSAGQSERRDYVAGRGPRMGPMGIPLGGEVSTVSVPCTIVTFQITHDEKVVWSQEFRFQAGTDVAMKSGQSMQEAINAAGRPTAAGLAGLAIPGYLLKDAAPGSPAALGASDLSPRGFIPVPKKPQQQPGIRKPAPAPTPNRTGLSA